MMLRTRPFSDDLLQQVYPNQPVLLFCKPHRPGCHQWRPMQNDVNVDIKELQPDVIVERYLEAKYFHYDPEHIYELSDYNVHADNLVESDSLVTMQFIQADEYSASASLNDNFQELDKGHKAIPEWEQEPKAIHPKWLEHHQSGHLTKDPGCPMCMEEAGSKLNHRRKKGDRSPGVMHCDLATFEASADGHKYCLVAAVTIEVNKESKLLPIFIPMPKKDAMCANAALKEALLMCDNRNLHQIPGSRIVRSQADGGGEFTNQKVRDLCWEKNITLSYSPAHQPSSNGIAERIVAILKSTVRRMLKQAHLDREWWSYACRFAGRMMREKVLGRELPHPLFGQLVGLWKSHDKAQAKSLHDRGCVGYLLDIDVWQSGATRIMQDGIVVKGLAPRRLDPTRYHLNPDTDLNALENGMLDRGLVSYRGGESLSQFGSGLETLLCRGCIVASD